MRDNSSVTLENTHGRSLAQQSTAPASSNGQHPAQTISRYVALGDSFTEGIGDPNPSSRNGVRGWADRVAIHLAQHNPGFRYANLAVRGRTMNDVITDQLPPAIEHKPDLVTIYAGMNDLLKMRADLDALMVRYAEALAALQRTGARVLTFTAADIGTVPVFRRLRGRAAIYNELLRAVADDLGVEVVDFWRFAEYRDRRLWDGDRIHLSPLGHQQMAARVLDTLDVPNGLSILDTVLSRPGPVIGFRAHLRWALAFAAPWLFRRMRRLTPGAGFEAKQQDLAAVV
jgi:lysophospholipase L1-like esterase